MATNENEARPAQWMAEAARCIFHRWCEARQSSACVRSEEMAAIIARHAPPAGEGKEHPRITDDEVQKAIAHADMPLALFAAELRDERSSKRCARREVDALRLVVDRLRNRIDNQPRPESYACQRCGRRDGLDAVASDEKWAAIACGVQGTWDLLCLWCMDDLAAAKHIETTVSLHFCGRAITGTSQSVADAEQIGRQAARITELKQRLADSEAAASAMRSDLESLAIAPDYDCPGDTPIVVAYQCVLCKAIASTEQEIHHLKSCSLASDAGTRLLAEMKAMRELLACHDEFDLGEGKPLIAQHGDVWFYFMDNEDGHGPFDSLFSAYQAWQQTQGASELRP